MALTERSKDICTIILPWGKYRYNSLPMGVCIATDVFQQRLSELVASIPHVYVFIDDILIVGKTSYKEHMQQVQQVLKALELSGMQVNPLKSFWAQSEVIPRLRHLQGWNSSSGQKGQSNIGFEAAHKSTPPSPFHRHDKLLSRRLARTLALSRSIDNDGWKKIKVPLG